MTWVKLFESWSFRNGRHQQTGELERWSEEEQLDESSVVVSPSIPPGSYARSHTSLIISTVRKDPHFLYIRSLTLDFR